MLTEGLSPAETDLDGDAGGAQLGMALAAHARIGILDRRDDPGDAGLDDGLGAGRRAAVVGTRLQRDIHRRAAGRLAGPIECHALGMRAPAGMGHAAPDDERARGRVSHDDGTDGGVGGGMTEVARAEGERRRHEARIEHLSGTRRRRGGEGFRRNRWSGHGQLSSCSRLRGMISPPASSPMISSKSLASRKLR